MSRKYRKPFATYQLGRIKPITIELDRKNLAKYRALTANPLYFENALTYCGGGLYRACLGYDVIWDAKAEADLMLCLDYLLTECNEQGTYQILDYRLRKPLKAYGIRWHRGVPPPKPLNFMLQWPFEAAKNSVVTVRINLLDKPHHCDLELSNGEVYTVSYMRFQRMLSNHYLKPIRSYKSHEQTRPKPPAGSVQKTTRRGLKLVKALRREECLRQNIPLKLHRMR